jgi:hypothetical protein
MALAYDYLMVNCGIKSDVLLKATALHKCQGNVVVVDDELHFTTLSKNTNEKAVMKYTCRFQCHKVSYIIYPYIS